MDRINPESVLQMATDIVIAYVGQRSVEPNELADLVRQVRAALGDETLAPAAATAADPDTQAVRAKPVAAPLSPAVPIEESITEDYLVSLEDGQRYRSLRRHLMAKYGITPEQYRAKWGLPADYPMVAPSYARDRSEVAKRIGLGRTPPAPPARGRRGRS
jgi:predicted transcriptional regulator